ncbi:MAG: hypothetical protein ACYC9Y_13855 [Candidatus Methylomirabilia bacterium]
MSCDRAIAFAGSWVSLECFGEDAEGIADFLFSAFPVEPRPPGDPAQRFRLAPGAQPGMLRIDRGGELFWQGEDHGLAADLLLSILSRDLGADVRGGLLLHAGVLSAEAGGVVLPALSGCGKTTLVAWLAARGRCFGSDEMAFVPEREQQALPFPRPLNVKQGAVGVIRGSCDIDRHYGAAIESPYGLLISPRVFSPEGAGAPRPWSLVVFPRYEEGAAFSLERLSKARAGMELMRHVINGARLPGNGFHEVARLAAAAPAYRLCYSDFAQLGPLEELLSGS